MAAPLRTFRPAVLSLAALLVAGVVAPAARAEAPAAPPGQSRQPPARDNKKDKDKDDDAPRGRGERR